MSAAAVPLRRGPWREALGKAAAELHLQPVVRAVADALAARSNEQAKRIGHPDHGIKVATIADDAGYSVRHTFRALAVLDDDLGAVERERHPNAPSHYHLRCPEDSRLWPFLVAWVRNAERWRLNKAELAWARSMARGLTARITPAEQPAPRGAFRCPEPGCGWEGARGPCQADHGRAPPAEVSPADT